MNGNKTQSENTASKKERIRMRYKGIDPSELDVIPAMPQENFYEDNKEKRVAVYVRVSTDDPRQTSSYELQKNHYLDIVNQRPCWKLVEIYADEGISGTSLQHRHAFVQLIEDCKAKKIDLIITKSVSRFARNVLDCVGYARQLAAMQPPIGIFFESENIYTLNSNSEMTLTIIAMLAQEESHNKSEIMNASIEMRFRRGIFLTPPLLGYNQNEDGQLIINEEEAKIVRLIFFMYLYGYTCSQIAETLTTLGRQTKKNSKSWSPGSILQILQNERHCGDVLARKTWTPNYLDHKSKKNKQDRNQYRKRNNHEAIISRDDFIAVQHLINNARYGNKGILPELQVIPDGALKGFVSINPRWAAFHADDYKAASSSVYDDATESLSNSFEVKAESGDFDLRGFEIARSQFFDTRRKLCVTFSADKIHFSTECIRKFDKTPYVEMLIHPSEHLLAVRPCSKETRNAIRWANVHSSQYYTRSISCAAYIKTLYTLLDWKLDCKYRVRGIHRQKENAALVIFDMRETELFIPQVVLNANQENVPKCALLFDEVEPLTVTGPNKDIMAYPSAWADNFGSDFYCHAQSRELTAIDLTGTWNISEKGQPVNTSLDLNITSPDVVRSQIKELVRDMKQEVSENGE